MMPALEVVKATALALLLAVLLYLFLAALQRLLRRVTLVRRISVPLNLVFLTWAIQLFLRLSELSVYPQVHLSLRAAQLFLFLYVLIRLLDHLLIDVLLRKERRARIPHLLRDIIRWVLVFVILVWVLNSVLGVNLTPLVATSAVFTLVISFALQDTLANLFAGIALNMEKPVEIGDWVTVGERTGEVVDMTWRATRLKSFDDDYFVIPNGSLAKESIVNLVAPLRFHGRHLKIGASYAAPPNKVKAVIRDVLRETAGVASDPQPFIRLEEYGEFSINYDIKFWVGPGSSILHVKDEVLTKIWYQFRRNGIEIPFPVRTVHLHTVSEAAEEARRQADIAGIAGVLTKIEILSPLSPQEIQEIAPNLLGLSYAKGEILVTQGEPGDSFFIIREGEVEVRVADEDGRSSVLAQLGRDAFFGEMSLLTGANRTATVTALEDTRVLVLSKAVFGRTISANPAIAEELSRVLERRQREILEKTAESKAISREQMDSIASASILTRIRDFFGL
jgi:small-conductance mechanosensitive channel/CRP-like cAMP-binding protein